MQREFQGCRYGTGRLAQELDLPTPEVSRSPCQNPAMLPVLQNSVSLIALLPSHSSLPVALSHSRSLDVSLALSHSCGLDVSLMLSHSHHPCPPPHQVSRSLCQNPAMLPVLQSLIAGLHSILALCGSVVTAGGSRPLSPCLCCPACAALYVPLCLNHFVPI